MATPEEYLEEVRRVAGLYLKAQGGLGRNGRHVDTLYQAVLTAGDLMKSDASPDIREGEDVLDDPVYGRQTELFGNTSGVAIGEHDALRAQCTRLKAELAGERDATQAARKEIEGLAAIRRDLDQGIGDPPEEVS